MSSNPNITASIVVYKEDISILKKSIDSFVKSSLAETLYIIDNSPSNSLEKEFHNPKVQYLFSGKNLGFGKGHNQILDQLKNASDFHLILNPDVVFEPQILESLTAELQKDSSYAMISPRILFPDKALQYTARKFPSVSEQLFRFLGISTKKTQKKEYRNANLNETFHPDFVHGNFMLFKTKDFLALKGFDERYFMYMEDVDICRRIKEMGKQVVYFPKVSAFHEFRKGSSKTLRLFLIHLNSMLKYYKKWGI